MAQRVGDRGTRTHKSTNGLRSSFEKCLYLRSIACATSGLAMITGKVGRGKWERRGEERRLERTEEGRDETRRDQSAARAVVVFRARLHRLRRPVQSSPTTPPSQFRLRPHRLRPLLGRRASSICNSPRSARRRRRPPRPSIVDSSRLPGICSRRSVSNTYV